MTTLDTAIQCQEQGLIPVLITANQKKPIEYQWQDKRYTPEQLHKRYSNNPGLNVGLLLGPTSGVIDIECDSPQSPKDKELLFAGCEKPITPSYTSKRGNHELYAWDDRLAAIDIATFKWRTVEVRLGTGGKAAQSLLPPSITEGFTREWINDLTTPLAKLPDVVIERLVSAANAKPEPEKPQQPVTKQEPIEDDYCRRAEWRKILEPHGWTYCGKSDDKDTFRRPGKKEGISADVVIGADGRQLLKVFTDGAPPFEQLENYNKFTAYTLLNHQGDPKAAKDHLAKAGYGRFRPHIISCRELATASFKQEFLIEDFMVAKQPMIVAGPQKSLKTTILIDFALSLATGCPFLDKLKVNRPARVLMMSGESGMSTIQETAFRISKSKYQDLAEVKNLNITDWLPRFDNPADRATLDEILKELGSEVCIIDPAYLCMPGTDSGNLFTQGAMLREVSQVCQSNGVAMVLAHHTRKMGKGSKDVHETPELTDIAWAGFSEFARQWLLLNRRDKYVPGSHEHNLWLSIGGSAGQSALWAGDFNEAPIDGKRQYHVTLYTPEEARQDKKEAQSDALRDKLLDVMDHLPKGEGDSFSALCSAADIRNDAKSSRLFAMLVREHVLEKYEFKKAGKKVDGYRLKQGEKS